MNYSPVINLIILFTLYILTVIFILKAGFIDPGIYESNSVRFGFKFKSAPSRLLNLRNKIYTFNKGYLRLFKYCRTCINIIAYLSFLFYSILLLINLLIIFRQFNSCKQDLSLQNMRYLCRKI